MPITGLTLCTPLRSRKFQVTQLLPLVIVHTCWHTPEFDSNTFSVLTQCLEVSAFLKVW